MANQSDKVVITTVKRELAITLILVLVAIVLTQLAYGYGRGSQPYDLLSYVVLLGDKSAIAILVGLSVRWLTVLFGETAARISAQPSGRVEVMEAMVKARSRVWFAQNWLHDGDGQGKILVEAKVPSDQLRVLFASFRLDDDEENGWVSPIYARGKSREYSASDVMTYVKASVLRFARAGKLTSVRFNFGHFPAWVVVIDNYVYWGPTPIHESNWAQDMLFRKDHVNNPLGQFWEDQFNRMWIMSSQDIAAEARWNKKLAEYVPQPGA